jgi:hypothetical protein
MGPNNDVQALKAEAVNTQEYHLDIGEWYVGIVHAHSSTVENAAVESVELYSEQQFPFPFPSPFLRCKEM